MTETAGAEAGAPVAGEDAAGTAEAGANPAEGVGAELARARASLGLSLEDVAQQLKFAPRQIAALEQERYAELPAGAFGRGMVRAYARLLKLDAEPLVERIAHKVATPDNTDAVVVASRRPIPITDSARRSNLVYAALSLALLGVIAGVVLEWRRDRASPTDMTFVAPVQAPSPTETPATLPAEPQRIDVASAPPGVALAQEAPAAASAAPVERAAPGMHRIGLRFERASWVEIRGGDGRVLLSQLNPGGTAQTIEGRPPFALVIGNAQHVRLTYDDKPVDLAPHVKVEVARLTLD
jgi:cytoskeleton protein RodZ